MKNIFQSTPLFKFFIFFLCGSIFASFINYTSVFLVIICFTSIVFLLVFFKLNYPKNYYFIIYLLISITGYLNIALFKEKLKKDSKYPETFIIGKAYISEIISEKENLITAIIKLKCDKLSRSKKILAYIEKDKEKTVKQGDFIEFNGFMKKINPSPYISSYYRLNFFYYKNIHYFINLKLKDYSISNKNCDVDLIVLFKRLQSRVSESFNNNYIKRENASILEAITIGIKSNISPDIKQVFINTGTIHVLAISGLHVGIIYVLILYIIKLFFYKIKYIYRFIIVILLLWFYCLLAGARPSIFRATLMFSLFQISNIIDKSANNFNILLFSAIVLLIINPSNFYDHGYYLSHLAMAGIILLYPYLSKMLEVKKKVPLYFWQLFCVSVSAQIFTYPYITYFFKQGSIYSCLSSLIVIPVLPFIIIASIFFIFFTFFDIKIYLLGKILNFLVSFLIEVLKIINNLPSLNYNYNLSFSHLVLIYGLLFSLIFLLYNKSLSKAFVLVLIFFMFYLLIDLFYLYKVGKSKTIVVYKEKEEGRLGVIFVDGFNTYVLSKIGNIDIKKDIVEFIYKNSKNKKINIRIIDKNLFKENSLFYKKDTINDLECFMFYGKKGIILEKAFIEGICFDNISWIIIGNKPKNIELTNLNNTLNYLRNGISVIINGYQGQKIGLSDSFYFLGDKGLFKENIKSNLIIK